MSHLAWTFDPVAFHGWLEEVIVADGELRLDTLYKLAKRVVADASPDTWHTLGYMRFDEEWFTKSDLEADESYTERWYLTVLAPWLRPAPSLAEKPLSSYGVLNIVLPLAGWPDEEVRELIFGQQIGSLARNYGNGLIAAEFGLIWDYGWLDLIEAERLLQRLEEAKPLFLSPPLERMEELVDWARMISRDPAEMLSDSYHAAYEMLLAALKRRQALFLILD